MTDQATRVVPAGWYDDPASPERVRWWNGLTWTEHVTAKPSRPVLVEQTVASGGTATATAESQANVTPLTRRELRERAEASGAETRGAESGDTGSRADGSVSAEASGADDAEARAAADRQREIAEARRLEQRFGVGTRDIPTIDDRALDESYRGHRVEPFRHEEEAPATRVRRASTSTAGAAGLVMTPVLALLIALVSAYVYYYLEPNPLLLAAPAVAYLLGILFALADSRTLRARGLTPPHPLWSLGTPLLYLVVRKVKVPGVGPLLGFVLIAALLPALGAALVMLGPAAGVATALDVQQQLRAELVDGGRATSVTCPMVLESTAPGTVYECDVTLPDGTPDIVYVGIGDEPGTFSYAFRVH